ncbi:MAG: ATP-binding cassette domain-containing protein, partial [Pseudomonadota bacterium]
MTSVVANLNDKAHSILTTNPPQDVQLTVPSARYAIKTTDLNLWYGTFQALFNINLKVKAGIITSLIGPSGCGKTTFLRSVNRINERLGYVRTKGSIDVIGNNIYGSDVNIVQLRKKIGMVFQRPNPLPVSIR